MDDETACSIPRNDRATQGGNPLVAGARPDGADGTLPAAACRSGRGSRWLLAGVLAITFGLHLWGIRHDLPYVTEDPVFAAAAARIAASGDLNPRWFGHPGSTLIYPLAGIYRVWYAVTNGGGLLKPDARLWAAFESGPAEFYLLGRLLTVTFAVASVVLVYQIGQRVYGEPAALIGSLCAAIQPTLVFAKRVRTDSATVFFAMLGLWCCLRLYERQTLANQLLAGAAVGLAIGTKYDLGMLVVVLLLIDGLIVWRHLRERQNVRRACTRAAVGLLGMALAFAVSTPYFFLDFTTAWRTMTNELRSGQLGVENWSHGSNLWYYLWTVIPEAIFLPQAICALVGLGLVVRNRRPHQLLLLVFVLTFLVAISFHPLHASQWPIAVLPLVSLLAAHGLTAAVAAVEVHVPRLRFLHPLVLTCGTVLLVAPPAYRVALMDMRFAQLSTSVLAREWAEHHLPAGSRVVYEWYTLPPPLKKNFVERPVSQLAVKKTVDYYTQHGFRYLLTSNRYYGVYLADPDHYPEEAAFYQDLFARGHLLHQVAPAENQEGTTIRIYEMNSAPRD